METIFCSIETEKVLFTWEKAKHIPNQGDAILIEEEAYSVVNRVWVNKNKVAVNVERIPRG